MFQKKTLKKHERDLINFPNDGWSTPKQITSHMQEIITCNFPLLSATEIPTAYHVCQNQATAKR